MTTSATIQVKTREELGLKENERPDGWCRFGYMDCFFGKTVPAEIDSGNDAHVKGDNGRHWVIYEGEYHIIKGRKNMNPCIKTEITVAFEDLVWRGNLFICQKAFVIHHNPSAMGSEEVYNRYVELKVGNQGFRVGHSAVIVTPIQDCVITRKAFDYIYENYSSLHPNDFKAVITT